MTKKYIIVKEDGEEVAIPNSEYWDNISEEKFNLLLKKSHIPQNYHDLDFEDYQGKISLESFNKCYSYAAKCKEEKFHNVSLYLVGNHGAQKTMIASAIGKEFIRQGLSVKFVYAGELIDLLLKAQGFDWNEEIQNKLKNYACLDLLIIDDIFDSNKSIYWQKNPQLIISAWDTFLRRQISEDKRIILTSNFAIDVIHEKFGESMFHLLDRNFIQLTFYDNIQTVRKERFNNLFED